MQPSLPRLVKGVASTTGTGAEHLNFRHYTQWSSSATLKVREMSLETFMERFGGDDPLAAHNLRCEMVARAIKAIGDSTKVTHAGGTCWRYPNVNNKEYGITSVLRKTYVASRLVLCCDTGKPNDYHNEDGDYMQAAHRTPVTCRFRDCLNPEHLYWATKADNCERREDEERSLKLAKEIAAKLIPRGSGIGS